MKKIHLTLACILFFTFSCQTIVRSNLFLWLGAFFSGSSEKGNLIYDADVYLFTSESGKQASFEVKLNLEPKSEVRIGPISVSDTTEGALVGGNYLTFTPSDWNTVQTITIKGLDDSLSDGNISYQVSLGNWLTEDGRFAEQSLPIIPLVNTDDETSGVATNPVSGLLTSENGTTAKIYYVLQTRPMRPVTLSGFSSSVPADATTPNTTLTFTYDNWDTAQYIEITGADDGAVIDGAQNYTISAGLTSSDDPSYNGKSVPVATGTNTDNDTAGFTVVSNTPLTITEAGGLAQFSVVMNTIPTGNVTISSIVASPATEGTATPSSLVFTSANWNVPQLVTVTGVNDFEADGNQTVTIVASSATSSDGYYNSTLCIPPATPLCPVAPSFPNVTNTDDDTRGFTLTPTSAVSFSENGGSQVFSFSLTSRPPAGQTVNITGINSSNAGLVTVSPATLSFSSANWNVPQSITATGQNNAIDEDTRSVTISFGSVDTSSGSRDTGYDSVTIPSSVSISVTDDDTAGFTMSPASGLVVNENAGPISTTFTVVLNSQPTATVNLTSITSSNTAEITVSPSSLSFTTANWNVAQTVTITSVLDGSLDGNGSVNINFANATSADAKYSGMSVSSVSATNVDSGTPQVILQNISSGLTLSENGTSTITFEIKLAILPGSTVTIGPIVSSDTSEIVVLDSSGNPTTSRSLTFTTTNGQANNFTGSSSTSGWDIAQTITIRSVTDAFDDGDIPVNINIPVAVGSFYAGLRPDQIISGYTPATGNLLVTLLDNDTKGFTISTGTVSVTEGGANGTFTVRLNSAPCDTPGTLANCATGSVTIPMSSEVFSAPDVTQYTFSPASLTFTQANWNTNQTVTIIPSNDSYDEILTRNHTFTLGAISSSGTDYDGQDPSDVTVSITDDDNPSPNKAAFALKAGSQAFTAENGLQTTYQLQLATSPIVGNSVTVTVTSTNSAEGRILVSTGPDVLASSNVYTFDSTNWNIPVDVIIRGEPDNGDTANVSYTVTVSGGTESGSTPSWYNSFVGATGATANLINYDVAVSKVTISTPASMSMAENAAAFQIYIFLVQAPSSSVTIPISLSTSYPCRLLSSPTVDQFAISSTTVTLDSSNWNTAGTHNQITVTPNDDAANDGTISCPIQVGTLTSGDAYYNGYDPTDPGLTLTDNDTSGYTVSNQTPSPFLTSWSGAQSAFDLILSSQPVADITVSYTPTPGGIVTFSPSTLTFTPSNYGSSQTVTMTGVNTGVSGDQNFTIALTSSSGEVTTGGTGSVLYQSLSAYTLPTSGSNIETIFDIIPCSSIVSCPGAGGANASGGLVGSPALNTTEAGGQARFQVRLRARPASGVTLGTITSNNTSEGTTSPTSLSFTTGNWNTLQDVYVTGIDDFSVDGNINFLAQLGSLSGGGTGFNGQTLPDVSITNTDDDTASVIITPTAGLVTTESGSTANFTIRLNSQPSSTVTIPLSSSNTAEGTIAVANVQFDGSCPGVDCWSTPKTITITGVEDAGAIDGNILYSIITGTITSGDTNYNGINPTDVSATNNDND
ncbi:beta strand repeat-containing protein [Leptospira ilyithenensis]|uniref:beta strand repeat-containing protein n=1 Tax=Leptospira ilyithenensis TaxID=2484901 RepID=UPI001FE44355|nr:Calx-beta domain-containing protein [Leptospira ilyithenensis]